MIHSQVLYPHRKTVDGSFISICLRCLAPVARSKVEADLAEHDNRHICGSFQQLDPFVAYEVRTHPKALSHDGLGDRWSRTKQASRTHAATLVLGFLCSIVAFLAIDPVRDRDLLFEQYDFKLWSHRDRLLVFCLSAVPSLAGMAIVLVAYKVIKTLVSIF